MPFRAEQSLQSPCRSKAAERRDTIFRLHNLATANWKHLFERDCAREADILYTRFAANLYTCASFIRLLHYAGVWRVPKLLSLPSWAPGWSLHSSADSVADPTTYHRTHTRPTSSHQRKMHDYFSAIDGLNRRNRVTPLDLTRNQQDPESVKRMGFCCP